MIMDKNAQVFVFGEIHGAEGNYEYMKSTLTSLREKGVRNFAMELPADAQDAFSSTLGSHQNKNASRDGAIHAENGAKLSGLGDYIGLAAHARALGMEVHCVDAPRDPNGSEMDRIARMDSKINQGKISGERYVEEVQKQFSRRNNHMADKVSQLQGNTVLLTGMFHTGGRGSIEENLRKRGMDVVSVDLYPQGNNPTVELFERNENPTVDLKVKTLSEGPSATDINSMISKLRGKAEMGNAGLKSNAGPLRRGHQPPFVQANIRRAEAVME